MYQQEVHGKRMSNWMGVGLILLIVLSIMLAGFFEQVIALMTGFSQAGLLAWVLVAVEVFLLLRLSVREYLYTLSDGRLIIQSKYGKSVRLLYDIPIHSISAIGAEDEIFRKFGNGQPFDKVVTRGCEIPAQAMAYRKDGNTRLILFQPDEKMIRLLNEQADASRKAENAAD